MILVRKEYASVSTWSGGSTTQLFIYPPEADYASRDFEIRVSSATVEEETSTFTNLPGYHRILMPLSAPLRLNYGEHGEISLNPLETAEFEGDWVTTSYGACVDLGIMLAKGWQARMKAVGSGTYANQKGFMGVYALEGFMKVDFKTEVDLKNESDFFNGILAQGDFLMLESRAELTLKSPSANAAVLIRVFR